MSYLNWHVGTKVVCIDPGAEDVPPNPIYGEVYTISFIYVDDDDGMVMIDLAELPNPESDEFMRGYQARCFRPVQKRKTSIEVFTRILSNPHVRIREDA